MKKPKRTTRKVLLQLNIRRWTWLHSLSILIFISLASGFASLLYFSYQDYVHPRNIYGDWIEIGSPPYKTDTLTLNGQGVLKNGRLVATQFKFDGKRVLIETGRGTTIYQISGTISSPQLKRIQPLTPSQRLIKKGFEHTIKTETVGFSQQRRSALSDHFSNK
ncbi:DUF2850 domain-containing protein [Vibrio sinensis]|uniref:DUF2850 domain-containing protein n=1 Tax=Vibrio sinensis TaxID=2302434 RepID=UPI001FB1AC30|nr:DUF2850 domain-containing protein [Vibrio sinensis]